MDLFKLRSPAGDWPSASQVEQALDLPWNSVASLARETPEATERRFDRLVQAKKAGKDLSRQHSEAVAIAGIVCTDALAGNRRGAEYLRPLPRTTRDLAVLFLDRLRQFGHGTMALRHIGFKNGAAYWWEAWSPATTWQAFISMLLEEQAGHVLEDVSLDADPDEASAG